MKLGYLRSCTYNKESFRFTLASLSNGLRKDQTSLGNSLRFSGKKVALFARYCDIITYLRYTIKIFAGIHRFAVFARIDFVFHIPPTEEGTIVRMIPLECENGVTLLFRRRSYPLLQILLFTRFTLSLAHCAIFFTHWIYDSSPDACTDA